MLTWNPADFLECLGVLPTEEEHGISHSYSVSKDGLRLDLQVHQYDGDIHLVLWRDGDQAPVVDVQIEECDAARWVHDERGSHLEFAAGRLFGGRYDSEAVIPYGVRLRVDPGIAIEFFRSPT